jgi:hypothetical protein
MKSHPRHKPVFVTKKDVLDFWRHWLQIDVNCPTKHFILRNQIEILDKNAQKGQKRNLYVRKWRNDVT